MEILIFIVFVESLAGIFVQISLTEFKLTLALFPIFSITRNLQADNNSGIVFLLKFVKILKIRFFLIFSDVRRFFRSDVFQSHNIYLFYD